MLTFLEIQEGKIAMEKKEHMPNSPKYFSSLSPTDRTNFTSNS